MTNTKQQCKDFTLFSWSKQTGLDPIHAKSADGVYVIDDAGKKYLDFSSQLMNVNIGHNNEHVKAAIKKQLDEVIYVFPGMTTDARGQLGAKLAEIAPGNLTKTFFTNGGSDAIENAIKLARVVTGKHKIISKYRSYHGATYGAISAGGDPRRHPVDRDEMPGVVHVEDPYCYRCPWGQKEGACSYECTQHIERVIQFEGPQNIAAILLEGESGSSGCIKYPPNYWQNIKAIADKYDILIIADEVMSGFGRCGQWFAVENFDIEPDMIVMAKGLTSGYVPLGGVIVSSEIAAYFDERPLPLGLTYSAHALACAAALATIEVYEKENLISGTRDMGEFLLDELNTLKDQHPSIGDVRVTGLLACIELVKDRETKEPMAPWNAGPADMKEMNLVIASLKEQGMFTFVRWNYIFIAPPLIITKEELSLGLSMISNAITKVDQFVQEKELAVS
ncbi:aminotransferase class III-fold pyridoxal phosphate-dependent enzyme [bacterium]|nr:aminotransferase class III-fold pyridoxal phosphate-dependent enzyme [bacterium]